LRGIEAESPVFCGFAAKNAPNLRIGFTPILIDLLPPVDIFLQCLS
jgi:hypothetical protein